MYYYFEFSRQVEPVRKVRNYKKRVSIVESTYEIKKEGEDDENSKPFNRSLYLIWQNFC